MAWGRLLRLRWSLGLVLGVSTAAAALSLSPEVQKGVAWLGSQVTSAGEVQGEEGSVATPLQNRDEALRTLQLLASGNAGLAASIATADTAATESLARQALSLGLAQDVSAQLAALASRQNSDGGIGNGVAAPSGALDSAWALAALSQQPAAYAMPIAGLKSWLFGQIWTDGGLAGLSPSARIESSSLLLLALQALVPDTATRNVMQKLQAYLAQAQGADGSWAGDLYLTGYALSALAPVSADGTAQQAATAFLKSQQGANGDWGNDPFLTAVILRALSATPKPVTPPEGNSIVGQVVSSAGNLPLSGVRVALEGSTIATTTGTSGEFKLSSLPSTSQVLTLTLAGYQPKGYTVSVPSTSQLNLGTVVMVPVSGTTTLSGVVLDVDTQQPLSGASLTLGSVPAVTVQTDAAGHYQISNLAAGSYPLLVSHGGYAAQAHQVSLASGSNLLQLGLRAESNETPLPTGPATLAGETVVLGSGAPLADVEVLVNQQSLLRSDAAGRFAFTLSAGSYRLDYQKAGYATLTQQVTVTDGSAVSIGKVALMPQRSTTRLSGVVRAADTQAAVAGATVQVLDGESAITGATGGYVLDNIVPTQFDVRVSAPGFDSVVTRLSVSFPGEVSYDFTLDPQVSQGLAIDTLAITPDSVGLHTEVLVQADFRNTGETELSVVPTLQVLDGSGNVVSAAVAYTTPAGSVPQGAVALSPGQSQPVYFRWSSGQFPPGAYYLVARGSSAGTISRSNVLGTVLAERQGSVSVTAATHLTGTLTATPPVQQAGNVQPVQITAILQNDGNVTAEAATVRAAITDEKTGATVLTLDAERPALGSNELATVAFAPWPQPAPGSYRVTLLDDQGRSLDIQGKVYVGDAAKGYFSVDKRVVPVGTQKVRGTVDLQGVDPVTGEITDPLAPLIKGAIQKAVTYNDTHASSWVSTNQCGGCHIASQAIVGGETNNGLASYNAAQRKLIIGQVLALQNIGSGYFEHSGTGDYRFTHSTLSMWGLTSVDDKSESMGNYSKGIDYILNFQGTSPQWSSDHDVNGRWWSTDIGTSTLNIRSLIAYSRLLQANPALTFNWHRDFTAYGAINSWAPSLTFDQDRNLYLSQTVAGTLQKISPDGVAQTLVSGYSDMRKVLLRPNGDIYIPYGAGLLKRSADGTLKQIASIRTIGIAESPAGEIFVSSYNNNMIYKLVDDKLVAFCGAPGNHYIAFGRDGKLYYSRWGSDAIMRVDSNCSLAVAGRYPGIGANVSQLLQLPNGNWAVSGTTGAYIMDENFRYTITKLHDGDVHALAVLDGNLLFSPNITGHKLKVWTGGFTPADFNIPARLDTALSRAKTWMQSANTVNTNGAQERAMQVIGLASLRDYFGPDATINAKLTTLETWLRAAQKPDGGWPVTKGGASDPLATAQVGYALDMLNPSPDDPAIRKAIQWVLGKQAADGSWYSPTMTTREATTTWVAIWLPVALSRVGGIDTDLDLTLPANVQLANPSLAPTSTAADSAGGTRYSWSFTGVTSAGRSLGFDLTLNDLQPNEQRAVALTAALGFNNSFTDSRVTAPLDIPVVTASNGLTLSLATDQASYGAHTPVAISAGVGNGSLLAQDGSVHLWVYAADGTLVSDLGTQTFASLATASQQVLSGSWNTGLYLPNAYYVQGTLLDAEGRQVSTQRQDFTVVASAAAGKLLGAQVTTDKGSYGPWDTVQVTDRVSNLTSNALVGELTLSTVITNADGEVVWSTQDSLAQLVAGALRDYAHAVKLANAPAGSYTVTLRVTDSNGVLQAQSGTTYLVQSSALTGAGLSGTLALAQKQIVKGDTQVVSVALLNQGNALLEALPVTVAIIDPVANAIVVQWQETLPVLAMGGTVNLSHAWPTQGSYGQSLVAVLTTGLTGSKPLAQAVFTLIKPPVTLAYGSDKPVYDVNETAVMGSDASSVAPIPLANLTLVQRISRPDGTVLWEGSRAGLSLAAQGSLHHDEPIVLGRAAPGLYPATLTLLDAEGVVLQQAQASFEVRSTAISGVGLTGSLAAAPQEVPEGETTTLALGVLNAGNAALVNVPLQVVVTHAATGEVVHQVSHTVAELPLDGSASQTLEWTPPGQAGTVYRAQLVSLLGGTARTLAETTLTMLPPPVKLAVSQQWGGQNRVLVYLSCQPDWQASKADWAPGNHDDPCFVSRQAKLSGYLDRLGVPHRIVITSEDFQREFRSGRYTSYWLLGAVETLSHGALEELREAVVRGDTLLADGGLQRWNNADLYPLMGFAYKGQQSCSAEPVSFAAPLFGADVTGAGAFATAGRPLTLEVTSATVAARLAGACGSQPAVLANALGQGKTLAFSFDLVDSLPDTSANWQAVLRDSLAYLLPAPVLPQAVIGGDYLRHAVTVTNEAKAADLIATVVLPAGSEAVATLPAATVNADGSLSYRFLLPEEGVQVLETLFRAPPLAGEYRVTTTLRLAGRNSDYGSYESAFSVQAAAVRRSAARVALATLVASGQDASRQKQALNKFDLAAAHYDKGKLGAAIDTLADAGELLGGISGAPAQAVRVQVATLLREWQQEWWRQCGNLSAGVTADAARCGQ